MSLKSSITVLSGITILLTGIGYPSPIRNLKTEKVVPFYVSPENLIDPRYRGIILEASETYGVCPILIDAIIKQESNYKPEARSKKGARGLMQVLPKTSKIYGVINLKQLADPRTNVMIGTEYLAKKLHRYKGNLDLALASYNAGSGAVARYKGVPPYKETRNYIKKIKETLKSKVGNLTYYQPLLSSEAVSVIKASQ